MQLRTVGLERSPLAPDRTRLVGEVCMDATGVSPERIWFDVEDELAPALSTSGNPWLALLLPFAYSTGESLTIAQPVDSLLRENVEGLQRVWHGWYPDLAPIAIQATIAPPPARTGTRTGAFFSGGVDSFHTLMRHTAGGDALHRLPIDDLITAWGFDIPLVNDEAFRRRAGRVAAIAERTGTASITIATNLRESTWNRTNWGKVGQGPALAAVAHALEGRLAQVLIPSSIPYRSGRHWGTNPLTDILLSTSHLAVRNDGAISSRREKLMAMAEVPLAMEQLHVCWMGAGDHNCGTCEKCLRTLTDLELLSVRERAVTFPPGAWSLDALRQLRLRNDSDRRSFSRLARRATEAGRPDIARALRASVRHYDLRVGAVRLLRRIGLRR